MSPEMSLFVGALLLLGAVVALAVSFDSSSSRSAVRARLRGAPSAVTVEDESPRRRMFVQDEQLGRFRYFIRPTGLQRLERDLVLAGRTSTWRLSTLILLKVAIPLVLLIPLLGWYALGPSPFKVLFVVGVLVLGYFVPDLVVKGRAQERQEAILYELPDVLDQVTISIESGLGFEGALARVGDNSNGPLGEEIVRVVQDSRLGVSRRDAYQALADRTEVDDLRRFLKAIIQAEEFGVPISKVVRTQAAELRTKRRQRAEEKAHKVALKLLFPMLFCMFPVLFILILTPAMINLGKVL